MFTMGMGASREQFQFCHYIYSAFISVKSRIHGSRPRTLPSRPRPRTYLHWGQGYGLQAKTKDLEQRPRPRTWNNGQDQGLGTKAKTKDLEQRPSPRTYHVVLEAPRHQGYGLKDSTLVSKWLVAGRGS